MNINDPRLWPSDVGPLNFEPAAGEFPREDEVTLVGADGARVASLRRLLSGECSVSVGDGHGTSVAMPPGSWELTVFDADGAVVGIRVLARTGACDDEAAEAWPPASVRAWALLAALWSLWTSTTGPGATG